MAEAGNERSAVNSVDAVCLALLLALQLAVSPVGTLTRNPPVYHDEYLTLSQPIDLLNGRGLALGFLRTPDALVPILGVSEPVTVPRQPSFLLAYAAALAASGPDIVAARALSWTLGLCCLIVTYLLGRREHCRLVGLGAGCLLALDSNFWLASRQVRPETWTVAMFLLGALLLPRALRLGRGGLAVLAGTFLGLGFLGHPIGVAGAGGALMLSLPYWRQAPRRVLAMALGPLILLGLAYTAWLFHHRQGFMNDLGKFTSSRGLQADQPILSHEIARYVSGYDNAYWMNYGETLFIGCLALCLVSLLYGFWRPSPPFRFARAALLGVTITAVLARDLNALYLVNLAPWIYLGGVAVMGWALGWVWNLIPKTRPAAAIGIGAFGLAAALFSEPYRNLAPVPSTGFDQIERVLEPAIPRGATLMGVETAFFMAQRREASYLYSRQYSGHGPSNSIYPVTAAWGEKAHLTQYAVHLPVIRELAAKAPFLFFLDQWDLGWNLYAPFGRYASVYEELNAALAKSFEPLSLVLTTERGLTGLWAYKDEPDPEAWRQALIHDGANPVRLGPDAVLRVGGPGRFDAARDAEGRLIFATEAGARYWLHVEASSENGALVVLTWNGVAFARQLDSRTAIPFDFPVEAEGPESELRFISYEQGAPVSITAVRATLLAPGPPRHALR